MRREAGDVKILLERMAFGDFMIRRSGGNLEHVIVNVDATRHLLGRLLGNPESNGGFVDFVLAGSGVVNLEVQLGSSGNAAGGTRRVDVRLATWKVRTQDAIGRPGCCPESRRRRPRRSRCR